MQRRNFIKLAGAATLAATLGGLPAGAANRLKVGAITDEISEDFEFALRFLQDYGLHHVEIRGVWGHTIAKADDNTVRKIRALVDRHGMTVQVVDTAYMKTVLPGTTTRVDKLYAGDFYSNNHPYEQDAELLERGIARARQLGAPFVRVFTFWRTDAPERMIDTAAEYLDKAAERAAREKVGLVVENEFSCNVASGDEIAALFRKVRHSNIYLNWDPANVCHLNKSPFPGEYAKVPKDRIRHMHVKDASSLGPKGKWVAVGKGVIEYPAMLRAVAADGFDGMLSIETHFAKPGPGGRIAASRESLEGLLAIVKQI